MLKFAAIQHQEHFKAIVSRFDEMMTVFSPVSNHVSIHEYFGARTGLVRSIKKLCNGGKLSAWKDFKGFYVILEGSTPIYTGI